jgi:hypothetical protein
MRLRSTLCSLSHVAQANGSGRCPFYQGFVPLCFSPRSVTGHRSPVGFVSNCSSRPFFNKTPKTMPKIRKTIETILLRLPANRSYERANLGTIPRPTKATQALRSTSHRPGAFREPRHKNPRPAGQIANCAEGSSAKGVGRTGALTGSARHKTLAAFASSR